MEDVTLVNNATLCMNATRHDVVVRKSTMHNFEYTYKWWRGNCEDSPLPTIGRSFQSVKVDLPFCIDVCTCAYVLKWYSALFFFFLLKKVNLPTFVRWNYCSALPMVEPPRCSERYTNCLSIIYIYTQRCTKNYSPPTGNEEYYTITPQRKTLRSRNNIVLVRIFRGKSCTSEIGLPVFNGVQNKCWSEMLPKLQQLLCTNNQNVISVITISPHSLSSRSHPRSLGTARVSWLVT